MLKIKFNFFLLNILVILTSSLFAFDNAPMWDLTKRKMPESEKEWLEWFFYADYRYPAYARRHFIEKGEDAISLLIPLLNEKNPSVRFYVLNTLAEIKSPETINVFVECLNDKDPKIISYALETLMTFSNSEITSSTLNLIRDKIKEDDLIVKISAMRALSVLGDESDIELMQNIEIKNYSSEPIKTFESNRSNAIEKLKIKIMENKYKNQNVLKGK